MGTQETPEAGDEHDPLWRPRNGRGKWVTSLTTIERDRQAAELAVQGLSYDAIAAELGMTDRSVAYKAVRRARLTAAAEDPSTTERRQAQLEELRDHKGTRPRPAPKPDPGRIPNRQGRDQRSDRGNHPRRSDPPRRNADHHKMQRERAKLTGTESARKSVTITGHADATVEEIRQCMSAWQPNRVREALAQAAAELNAKNAIPGTLRQRRTPRRPASTLLTRGVRATSAAGNARAYAGRSRRPGLWLTVNRVVRGRFRRGA